MEINLRKASALLKEINSKLTSIKPEPLAQISLHEPNLIEAVNTATETYADELTNYLNLLISMYEIRAQVGEANASTEIGNLLTMKAGIDKLLAFYSELVLQSPRKSDSIIESQVAVALSALKDSTNIYSRNSDTLSVSLLQPNDIKTLKEEMDNAKRQKTSITDKLLELNMTTEIELSNETVKLLKQNGLI